MKERHQGVTDQGLVPPPVAPPYNPDHKNYLSAEYEVSLKDPDKAPYSKEHRTIAVVVACVVLGYLIVGTLTDNLYLPAKRSGIVKLPRIDGVGFALGIATSLIGYFRHIFSPEPAKRPWSNTDAALVISGYFLFVALPIWLPRMLG
ncbi:MAG TPA: hypothetical protein VF450_23405 [Noviherbaspirillum sp.]